MPDERSSLDRIGLARNSWILASVPTVALTPLRSASTAESALRAEGVREREARQGWDSERVRGREWATHLPLAAAV